jgi:hypothetical protein
VQSAIEGVDGARDDHRGQARVELLGAAHQLVAVHLRHQEVAQDQVERAGKRSLKVFQCFLSGVDRHDAVATGFEKEGADREHLFVVVYAEDRLLGAHAVSLLPDATLWWLAADGPAGASAGLQAHLLVVQKIAPWPGLLRPSARDGPSAPGERKAKSEALPSAPPGTRSICPTSEAAEPRGAREALCHGRLPGGSGRQGIALLRIQ